MTPMKDMLVLTKEVGASTLACEIGVKLGLVVDRGCVCWSGLGWRFKSCNVADMWRICLRQSTVANAQVQSEGDNACPCYSSSTSATRHHFHIFHKF